MGKYDGPPYPKDPPIDSISGLALLIKDGVTSGDLLGHLRRNAADVHYTTWVIRGYVSQLLVGMPEEISPIGRLPESPELLDAAAELAMSLQQAGLVEAPVFAAAGETKGIPWSIIIPILLKLLEKLLSDEAPK